MAITVSWRDRDTPLVVSVLPAQRRFADEVSSAITTQSSHSATARARSIVFCGLMRCLPLASGASFPRRSFLAPQSSRRRAPSARQSRRHRAPPPRSRPLLRGVEDPHSPHEHRGAAMADRCDLSWLALAAVERAAEHVRLGAADGLHGVPEVRSGRLVGHIAQLAGKPAVLDLVKPLAGELEVVPLHVDGPALVAEDVDAALH